MGHFVKVIDAAVETETSVLLSVGFTFHLCAAFSKEPLSRRRPSGGLSAKTQSLLPIKSMNE